jgi:hypothetical protein
MFHANVFGAAYDYVTNSKWSYFFIQLVGKYKPFILFLFFFPGSQNSVACISSILQLIFEMLLFTYVYWDEFMRERLFPNWVVTLYILVDRYWHFGTTCCLHLQCWNLPLHHTSVLKIEAAFSSETSVSAFKTTWCHNPEDYSLSNYHCENLKTYIVSVFIFLSNLPFRTH